MLINSSGNIDQEYWYDLLNHYLGLEFDILLVKSSHIHGIIVFDDARAGFWVEPFVPL